MQPINQSDKFDQLRSDLTSKVQALSGAVKAVQDESDARKEKARTYGGSRAAEQLKYHLAAETALSIKLQLVQIEQQIQMLGRL